LIIHFNKEIKENVLPTSLIHLTFGYYFNQEIKENVLPKSLTHLNFDHYFNQEIKENVLPTNLTHLTFRGCFNKKISIPKSLIELLFSNNCPIKDNIPDFIENIVIFFHNDEKITNLPSSIKRIKINNMSKIELIEKIPFGCIVEQL
jgi:hypothetical protein